MERTTRSPVVRAKTPPVDRTEVTTDEEGKSPGRSPDRSGKPFKMKKLKKKRRASRDTTQDATKEATTASTCSESSRRGVSPALSPKSPLHNGGTRTHVDSLEEVPHREKLYEKQSKTRMDTVAIAVHGVVSKENIPDAGQGTTMAYTVFENDHMQNAKLAECNEKEAKLQWTSDSKKKKEKKESKRKSHHGKSIEEPTRRNSAGKSVEVVKKKSKKHGRTNESPSDQRKIKSPGTRTARADMKSRESRKSSMSPRSHGSK